MRTLVISPMLPPLAESDRGGMQRRFSLFLRALSRLSSSLEIIYIVPEKLMSLADNQAALDRGQSRFWGIELKVSLLPRAGRAENHWNHYVSGIFHASAQPQLHPFSGASVSQQIGHRLDSSPHCVFVDRLEAMIPILRSGCRPRRLLLDLNDLYHKVLLRTLIHEPWRMGKVPLAFHLPGLLQAERRAVAQSTVSLVCSDADRTHLRRLGFRGVLEVVPNAIVPPDIPPELSSELTVLFLGTHHYPPNRIAAERLARRIWPIVRREITDARLVIAGAASETLPSRHAGLPGVEYLGFVDDLNGLYKRARLVCTPIEYGGGTRIKLIEAAGYARPMVSTPIGAEGLSFVDGKEILSRQSDAELSQACIALLRDDALCVRLGAAAREKAKSLYDARTVERQVEHIITSSILNLSS
jgi:glycosyltransferase involved in cell wall biosynthesis